MVESNQMSLEFIVTFANYHSLTHIQRASDLIALDALGIQVILPSRILPFRASSNRFRAGFLTFEHDCIRKSINQTMSSFPFSYDNISACNRLAIAPQAYHSN